MKFCFHWIVYISHIFMQLGSIELKPLAKTFIFTCLVNLENSAMILIVYEIHLRVKRLEIYVNTIAFEQQLFFRVYKNNSWV